MLVGSRHLNKRMCLFAEGLIEHGYEVSILAPPRSCWKWNRGEAGRLQLVAGRLFLHTENAKPLSRPDQVVCFHWSMLPLAATFQALPNVRVVYDEYDFYELNTLEGEGSRVRRFAYQQLVRGLHFSLLPAMDMVTCIHLAKGFLKHRLQRRNQNVVELHNYPTQNWLTPHESSEQANSQKICFVFVGGIWEVKGCRVVAQAFQNLQQRTNAAVELHYFGSGDQQLTDWLKSQSNINVHGESSPAEIRDFLRSNRCVGLMLYQNGPRYRLLGTNSRKMFEYVATGAALLATGIGEVTQFVKQHDIGFLVPPDTSVTELTETFEKILADPVALDRKRTNSRQLMHNARLCWETEWQKAIDCGLLDGNVTPTLPLNVQPATTSEYKQPHADAA